MATALSPLLILIALLQAPAAATVAPVEVRYGEAVVALDAARLAHVARQRVTVSDRSQSRMFEGVWLRDLLALVHAPLGDALRGEALQLIVVVDARDGYHAVFSLAEIDPAVRDRAILLADRQDGQPLDGTAGPWRLVVADEVRAARWVRQVMRIRVVSVKDLDRDAQ